ncbi:Protein of unknown function [Cotesia congregata]|uniref:Transposase domain-containing protein n=1 Tax=Cotesia congregata TaxID=51543 RepID=A0A8J2ECN2_COTCN|nr:Protein of unknown function [Cotesia congregata]
MSNKNFHDLSKRRKRDYLNSIYRINNVPDENNYENEYFHQIGILKKIRSANVENLPLVQENNNNSFENENHSADEDDTTLDGMPELQNTADSRTIDCITHQRNTDDQTSNQDVCDPNRESRRDGENLDCYEEIEEEQEEEEQIFTDEENEDENQRNNNNQNYDLPLYNGAPLTISQSMLLIATLLITHNVNQSCLTDIISIINLHCLTDSLHKNSLFKFKKFFALGNHNFKNHKKHYYCSNCLKNLNSVIDACPECLNSKPAHFITLSISEQLREFMRTSEQSREYGNLALLNNKEHFGVKGPCALSNIMPDFIAGTAIDKMHCVDNGVVKKLLSLWFDSAYSSFHYSLYSVIEVINERLTSIKPPKFVHRLPRTLQELTHWKASELRMWFFYYSLPVLSGIMQNIYFEHFMLLITSIAYLTADSISNEMIDNAQILLNKFVHDFETLYGLQNCSINVHSLLHLPELVRRIRPLWSTSCYVFEDLNGQFLKLIHGTRHIDSQIASTHGQVLRMQQYQEQLPDGPVRDFCISKKYGVKICEKLFRHCYSVGTYSYFDDFPPFLHRAVHHLLPIRNIKKYYRLLKDGKLYISDQYSRDLKTISSDVQYIDNTGTPCFGRIYCFTKITECKCLTACHCNGIHQAIIKKFEFNNAFQLSYNNIKIPYLYEFWITEEYVAVPVQFLKSVCISMEVDNRSFIAVPVNTTELE